MLRAVLPVFSGSLLLSGLQVAHSPAAVDPDDVQLCPVPLLQALLVHLPVRLSVAVFLHHTEISLPQYPADICPPDEALLHFLHGLLGCYQAHIRTSPDRERHERQQSFRTTSGEDQDYWAGELHQMWRCPETGSGGESGTA